MIVQVDQRPPGAFDLSAIEFMNADQLQIVLFSAVGFGCIVVWIRLWSHRQRTAPLVPWEPRRPVPWGPFGLAVAFLLSALAAVDTWICWWQGWQPPAPASLDEFLWQTWTSSAVALFLIIATQIWLWGTRIATARDLGWGTNLETWRHDILLGLVAAIAAIGPVYAIQIAMVWGFHWPTSHHLIDQFLREPRISVVITISFSVIIQAPIFEELLFRQLAQGWLERIWDELAGWNDRPDQSGDSTSDPAISRIDASGTFAEPDPPAPSHAEYPRPWWPIGISSALFALAHVGQGAAPIPLFFLALVLGYLYQQTHRIVPCIVLHMIFNAFSLILLGVDAWGS
ncbi:MAG: CPBP family intramembrane metalloprotease [Pirellulales bacterium]|nr:CPBP family intramembrane metalloprotease [Pirellulales bacterium]